MTAAPPPGRYQKALARLRRSYRLEMVRRVRAVCALVRRIDREGWQPPLVAALYRLSHSLSGSAAIYGFDAVSAAAASLESRALAALESGSAPPADPLAPLAPLARRLRRAARPPVGP